jgi:SAM-dependent methyltransferase
LYQEAKTDWSLIPWADLTPNPHLLAWQVRNRIDGKGKRALKVGCGLGDDAEELASWGFDVVAFDISPTAISLCRERFPSSRVEYRVTDLFDPPALWTAGFDFVLESYTLQVLPVARRGDAMRRIVSFVAPRGSLLVIARGREESDGAGEMPWPLTQAEFGFFESAGLRRDSWEDFMDAETPAVRRFRACYQRR